MSPAFWAVALFLFLRTSGGPVGESWVLRSAYHGETAAYGSGGCERRSVVVRTWIVAVFFSLQRPPPSPPTKAFRTYALWGFGKMVGPGTGGMYVRRGHIHGPAIGNEIAS